MANNAECPVDGQECQTIGGRGGRWFAANALSAWRNSSIPCSCAADVMTGGNESRPEQPSNRTTSSATWRGLPGLDQVDLADGDHGATQPKQGGDVDVLDCLWA